MGIGGGTITRKLLFAVLLISSLSLSGIAGVNASDVVTAQTQNNNTNIVQEKFNKEINNTKCTNKSTIMQKNVDNDLKIVEKQVQTHEHTKLHKNVTTPNKNIVKQEKNYRAGKISLNKNHNVVQNIAPVNHWYNAISKYTAQKRTKETTKITNYKVNAVNNQKTTLTNLISKNLVNTATIQSTTDISKTNNINIQKPEAINNQRFSMHRNEISTNSSMFAKHGFATGKTKDFSMFAKQNLQAAAGEPKGTTSSTTEAPLAAGSPSTSKVPASLQPYLKATKNCQVTNSQIKSLAAKITKGKTTTYAKAVAIFNWVRDNLGYSFYYNTKKGAVGTLNAKTGNCVDTTHLLIALERAAGIPARYVHGKAKFTSGHVYGHVWAEVYVNGKWYKADATSSKNSFGVVKNWSSATIKGRYASLSF